MSEYLVASEKKKKRYCCFPPLVPIIFRLAYLKWRLVRSGLSRTRF